MNNWSVEHRSAFLNKDITVDNNIYNVKCVIHSKISPTMDNKNFSWSVKSHNIHISGHAYTFELCKTNVDTVINQILPVVIKALP